MGSRAIALSAMTIGSFSIAHAMEGVLTVSQQAGFTLGAVTALVGVIIAIREGRNG